MGFFGNSSAYDKIDRDVTAIADGAADLSHSVGAPGNNTAGRISGNINRLFSRVRTLISHSRERSISIAANAARMNHLVQQTDDAVRRQEVLAANVFDSSNRVNQSVGEVAMNSDAIQASTHNNLDLAQRSLEQMETVASTMRSTNQHIEHFSSTVGELHTSSMKINQIVSLINDISDQTNLLALNAAIEAARAGEQGLGFAVVADEVRKLAERAAEAAKEISELIRESTKRVTDGVTLSARVGQSLEAIVEASSRSAATIAAITAATESQSSNASEVKLAIRSVSQTTEGTAANAEELAASGEQLNAQAESLKSLVQNFRV
jgi:methyl-accepting chemotaxis protein